METVKPAQVRSGDRLAHREFSGGQIVLTWDEVAHVTKEGRRYLITYTDGQTELVGAGTHYTRKA